MSSSWPTRAPAIVQSREAAPSVYSSGQSGSARARACLGLACGRRLRNGTFATNDFDYMKPAANLKAEFKGAGSYEKGSFETYDYPGRYTEQDLGKRRAKVRLEAEQALDHRRTASGDAASFTRWSCNDSRPSR